MTEAGAGPASGAPPPGRLRVALLYGGRSAEHPVSVVSARSVLEALDPERFEVVPIAITRRGAWLLPDASPLELTAPEGSLPEVGNGGALLALAPEQGSRALSGGTAGPIDVVIPMLHGPFGEDGTVQGMLELAGLPYVGSGVLASALAMDKPMAKAVLAAAGLPQVPWVEVREQLWRREPKRVRDDIAVKLGYPVFTKPCRLGSSIGITKVVRDADLDDALEVAFSHDDRAVVEQGLSAREVECGVLGNADPEASVVGEIVPCHEFYDFEAKYLDDSKLMIPAPVPDAVAEEVRASAVRAFTALGCEGMARVDFFYDERAGRVVLNEVNTIPGFTPKSMFPLLWAASGVPFGELVTRLIDLSLERRPRG